MALHEQYVAICNMNSGEIKTKKKKKEKKNQNKNSFKRLVSRVSPTSQILCMYVMENMSI